MRRTLLATVVAYGLTFAGTVGTLAIGGLLTSLEFLQRSPGPVVPGGPAPHPLLLANPIFAMVTALQTIPMGSVTLGKVLPLLVLSPASGSAFGPVVQPWLATVLVQAVLVTASVLGSVRVLRGRRILRTLRPRRPAPS